jgi:hypothetical protein
MASRRLGPATIETCDEACAGCEVLVDSEGKLRDSTRELRSEEEVAVDAFFVDYLMSPECAADEQRLEPASNGARDDVSRVKMVVDGSFTKENARQTLVVFFAGHCGVLGSHSEGWGKTFDLLFQDGKVISSSEAGPSGVELRAVELDRDGFSELVELSADYGSGTTFTQAAVWSYRDGSAKTLSTFELSRDSCNLPDGEHFESSLLARFDEARNVLCFQTKRRNIGCPASP